MKKPKGKAAKRVVKKAAKKPAKAIAKKSAAKKTSGKKSPVKKSAKKAVVRNQRAAATPQFSFNWHDLMTPDVEGAKHFYGEVVGWSTSQQMPQYTVLEVGGMGVGGMMETPDNLKGTPPFWAGYIAVKNVDKACVALKKAGGVVHREPWDIPEVLRMAVVSDPAGGVFYMYTPVPRGAMKQPNEGATGTVGWNELMTSDLAGAAKFYARQFGWTKGDVHDMGPEYGKYHLFKVKRKNHAGMMKRPASMPRDNWGFYFNVHGLEAAIDRIVSNGGKITNGPMQVPTGSWVVNAIDPQGAHFSLMSKSK